MNHDDAAATGIGRIEPLPSSFAEPVESGLPSRPQGAVPQIGMTIYGCDQDEAAFFREMAPRYGVLPTIGDAAASDLTRELARGDRCISVSHKTRISGSVLVALRRAGVRYISTRSVGYDHIDVRCAQRVGIFVETVEYSPDSVADYTLMLMLMAVRNAKATIDRVQAHDYRLDNLRGKELRDMTVGVIGTGRIGSAVINRLRGFGCRILAYDLCLESPVDYVPLDVLLQESDLVTIHTPGNPGTYHLLNRHRIALMRPGAFIVNTGRGSLLETEALLSSLESGHLGGAALDVLEGEEGIFYADLRQRPVENDVFQRLRQLPNVLITPHTAYYTDHAQRDVVENTLRNCLRYYRRAA